MRGQWGRAVSSVSGFCWFTVLFLFEKHKDKVCIWRFSISEKTDDNLEFDKKLLSDYRAVVFNLSIKQELKLLRLRMFDVSVSWVHTGSSDPARLSMQEEPELRKEPGQAQGKTSRIHTEGSHLNATAAAIELPWQPHWDALIRLQLISATSDNAC